jgi:hypothetical protein
MHPWSLGLTVALTLMNLNMSLGRHTLRLMGKLRLHSWM